MLLCEKEDLALARKIVERYNLLNEPTTQIVDEKVEMLEMEIDEKSAELYADGDEPDTIEVPVELFHRMAAEVEHHKAMLSGTGAGVVVTLGASTTGLATYGIAKDIRIEFRINLRAPEGHELTDEEIDKMVLAAMDGFRGTLSVEAETLKGEVKALKERLNVN